VSAGLFQGTFQYAVESAELPPAVCQNLTFDAFNLVLDSGEVPLTMHVDWSFQGKGIVGDNHGIAGLDANIRIFLNVSFESPSESVAHVSAVNLHMASNPDKMRLLAPHLDRWLEEKVKIAVEGLGSWVLEKAIKSCLHEPEWSGLERPCPPDMRKVWANATDRPVLMSVSHDMVFFSGAKLMSFTSLLICLGVCCHAYLRSRQSRAALMDEATPLGGTRKFHEANVSHIVSIHSLGQNTSSLKAPLLE